MNLQQRIEILSRLSKYILDNNEEWKEVKIRAGHENAWFTPQFVDLAATQIAQKFLQPAILEVWTNRYHLLNNGNAKQIMPLKTIGIVMAGNIPLVGFHDLVCVFITGHKAMIKVSSKDSLLITHLIGKMKGWNAEIENLIIKSDLLKNCDAYIATGSNNSSRYFDYYFARYPHLIRRNRTSIALLTGDESNDNLEKLADDVYLYFGLGCRNVTKIFIPKGYDFIPLLEAFKKYNYLADHFKYKNNYDYHLALHLLNKVYYMCNDSLLLIENNSNFSPISQLNYEYYDSLEKVLTEKTGNDEIQCIIGRNHVPFGQAQSPVIDDYADGVDTMQFLTNL